MMNRRTILGSVLALAAAPAWADHTTNVRFAPRRHGATLSGEIRGQEFHDYRLDARRGQHMSVTLQADGTAYFNILPPGSTGEAVFIGSEQGATAHRVGLHQGGDWRVRVYLLGNDADRGHRVAYTLSISIT